MKRLIWPVLALLLAPVAAHAQSYPSQDIHIIAGFPPGSGSDVLVRYFAEKLKPLAGRTVVVENKPGATGNIAIEYTARSKPDGYTILLHSGSATAANMSLYRNPPVDVGKALQMASGINKQAFMLVVDAKKPWHNVAELTAALKAKGDKATYATAAVTSRVMGALYKKTAGFDAVEVQYKSAPDSLNDMTSGAIDFAFHDPLFANAQAREGRFRILAVVSRERMATSPDIPTMTEQGIPSNHAGWFGTMVPAATPKPVVNQINAWFNTILVMPETKKFLNEAGGDPYIDTPDNVQKFLLQEIENWRGYIRDSNIEPAG